MNNEEWIIDLLHHKNAWLRQHSPQSPILWPHPVLALPKRPSPCERRGTSRSDRVRLHSLLLLFLNCFQCSKSVYWETAHGIHGLNRFFTDSFMIIAYTHHDLIVTLTACVKASAKTWRAIVFDWASTSCANSRDAFQRCANWFEKTAQFVWWKTAQQSSRQLLVRSVL